MPASQVTNPLLALAFAALLGACAPKPATSVAAPDPVTDPMAAANPEGPRDDDGDARRNRMLERARSAFRTVYFPYDQAVLDAQAKAVLQDVLAFLREFPEVTVTIEGHADERGTTEYNLALGSRRAEAVTGYLKAAGVPGGRLQTLSFGEEKPARQGATEEAWRLNRRADFEPVL